MQKDESQSACRNICSFYLLLCKTQFACHQWTVAVLYNKKPVLFLFILREMIFVLMRQINLGHLYNIVASRFVFPMITIENNFSLDMELLIHSNFVFYA